MEAADKLKTLQLILQKYFSDSNCPERKCLKVDRCPLESVMHIANMLE